MSCNDPVNRGREPADPERPGLALCFFFSVLFVGAAIYAVARAIIVIFPT